MAGEHGLLDTNVMILRRWVDPSELPDEVAISAVTLAELSAGPHLVRPNTEQADYDERVECARRMDVLQRAEHEFDPIPFDAEAARSFGRMTAAVLAAGRQPRRRLADLMITSVAVAHDLPLYTTNPGAFAGKTTLLEELHAELGGRYTSLDRPGDFAGAREDPIGFVAQPGRPMFIDEVQRGGDNLIRAIKLAVDADRRRGQFILTGSSRFLTVPTLSESLAGRLGLVDMWQLSVAELIGEPSTFLDHLLSEPYELIGASSTPTSRHDYMRLVCLGGFPDAALAPSERSRGRWHASYATTVVQRDIQDIATVHRADMLPRLMQVLAARTAQELNVSELARSLQLDVQTIRNYLSLFETTFVHRRLGAWSGNLTSRIKHRPKIHMTDSGLAAHLVGQDADALARPGDPAAGSLLETFVVNELFKIRDASDHQVGVFHFRDREQREIDIILEAPDGRVTGLEVKASASVDPRDFRHLAFAKERLGDRFAAGIVLYTGQNPVPFGDDMLALPVNLLWNGRRRPE